MKRFKNILYHADGDMADNESLDRAVNLARRNDAMLTVMDVVAESELAVDVEKHLDINLNQLLRERRLEELERLVEPHMNSGLLINTQIGSGKPFIELIHAVQRNGYDLLMKAPHPPEGLTERFFYGSFDLHLLRKCPCPVWIDRPESAHPYRQILAAVDTTEQSCLELNRFIMDLASSLAEREAAQLHVVQAWRLPGESMLRSGRARIPPSELEQLLADTQQSHRQRLNDLLKDYGLASDSSRVWLVKGNAPYAITSRADDIKADLIVMGTLGRTGLPGLIIGNTAEDVLQTTRSSILAVKPEGFVSPVSLP